MGKWSFHRGRCSRRQCGRTVRTAGGDGGQLAAVGVGVLGGGNIHHGQNISIEQRYLSHLAVHIAGDDGQRAGVTVHTAHDAHGLHGLSVSYGSGLRLGSGGTHAGRSGVGEIRGIKGGHVLGGRGGIQRSSAGFLKFCAVLALGVHAEQVVQTVRCAIGAAVHSHGAGDVLIINNDVAHIGGAAVLAVQQPVHVAHGTAQGKHAGLLRDSALGDTGVLQAVREEHHVPLAVGVAVGLTVAGVVAQGHAVRGVDLKVFLALLVAQLGLCHAEQVLVPVAGHHGLVVGGLPLLGGLNVGGGVAQAGYGVVMLRQGAGKHFLVAGVGVVVVDGLHGVHRRLQCHRLGHGHSRQLGALGGLHHLLHKLALFQSTGQLVLGGIAAFVVGMLKFVADQAAVLRVEAVVIVDVLFFHAGQSLHLGVAVVGVLMGHKLDLRLQRQRHGFSLNGGLAGRSSGGHLVRIFKLAFLVTADEHLGVAICGVGVLLLAALVLRGHRDAHAMQLPVDEQGGDHGKCQHKCGVAPQGVPVLAEPLHVRFKNVVHNEIPPPGVNGSTRSWTRAISSGTPCQRSGFFLRSLSRCCGCRWRWSGGRPARSSGFPAPDRGTGCRIRPRSARPHRVRPVPRRLPRPRRSRPYRSHHRAAR